MKLGIVALTPAGIRLAQEIAAKYPGETDIYFPDAAGHEIKNGHHFTGPLHDLVPALFQSYGRLLFIMSLGIVVRVIAPWIKDKYTDPAVAVMDEQGQHVISVLSGHLGGANTLANSIAELSGAKPVITTASDIQGKLALDVLARQKDLLIEPLENLKYLNSGLVRGEKITVFYDASLRNIHVLNRLIGNWAEIASLDHAYGHESVAVAFLTSKQLPEPQVPYLYLRPRNLYVGVGCKAGTSKNEILAALRGALELAKRSLASVKAICSVELKAQEKGLLEVGTELHLPLYFYSSAEIKEKYAEDDNLSKSTFVLNKIGVEGVCEPTALLGDCTAKLILRKTSWPKVTVAIAEATWQL